MNARAFGFDTPVGGTSDHRSQERVGVRMPARLRDRAANKYDVHLLDLSVTGFRAEAHYSLDAGAIVWLTIPGLQGLEATVAWRRAAVLGCKFRQPLYPAVLDLIVRSLCGCSVVLARYRTLFRDPANRFSQHRRDRLVADLGRLRDDSVIADRIGNHQLLARRSFDARDRAARQHAVRDIRDDARRAGI